MKKVRRPPKLTSRPPAPNGASQPSQVAPIACPATSSPVLPPSDLEPATQPSPEEFTWAFEPWNQNDPGRLAVLKSIVESRLVVQGKLRPVAWATETELRLAHGDTLVDAMLRDSVGVPGGYLERWAHPDGYLAVTLSPWGAYVVGHKLVEYTITWVSRFRGECVKTGKRVWKRRRRWDLELMWVRSCVPDRSCRCPRDSLEHPLTFDPEDRRARPEASTNRVLWVADLDTGETTEDQGKAFCFTMSQCGVEVKIPVRLDARPGKPIPKPKPKSPRKTGKPAKPKKRSSPRLANTHK